MAILGFVTQQDLESVYGQIGKLYGLLDEARHEIELLKIEMRAPACPWERCRHAECAKKK